MPRNPGTGVYEQPAPDVITATTIESAVYNGFVNDVETDLNTPRPIVAGGTGANNATQARDNLDTEVANQIITNFDTAIWESGSFTSAGSATNPPVAAHAFGGSAVVVNNDQNYILVEAHDISDGAVIPGKTYVREKRAGVWSAWTLSDPITLAANKVDRAGDTMTGDLKISKTNPSLILNKPTSGTFATIIGQTNNLNRWALQLGDGTGEGGSNAGSNFAIASYSDAGAVLDAAILTINRSSSAITISPHAGNYASVQLNKPTSGVGSVVTGATATVNRWHLYLGDTTAEGGSDTGSNFSVFRCNDAGTITGTPLAINRATGNATFSGGIALNNLSFGANPGFGNTTIGAQLGADIFFISRATAPVIVCNLNTDGASVFFNRSSTTVGNISVTTTATAYNTSSDANLKEDLKSFDAGNIIDDTQVYDFRWKATGERAYGVIAQQAAEVYDTPTFHDKETDRWFVDYSKYVPVILQELKALRARVAELEMKLGEKPA